MELSDLRYFEAVARLGGMNRAALELHTVQSNVTARIRALEHELGAALFVRHSRGVELTKAGKRLLPYALRIADAVVEARRTVADDGVPAGPLLLGSLETTASLRLSPLITRFSQKYPAVDVSLRVDNNENLVRRISANDLDGAFICGPVNHPHIVGEIAFREELVIAGAPGDASANPLAPGCRILVKGAGCAYRDRLERLLAAAGINDMVTRELGTVDAIVGCVEAGLGITLLPRALMTDAERKGRLRIHTLPPEIAMVETWFIRRSGSAPWSTMTAFLDMLRATASCAEDNRPAAARGGDHVSAPIQ